MLTTSEVFDLLVSKCASKNKMRWNELLIRSIFANLFLGFGCILSLTIAGGMETESAGVRKLALGAVFPVGLIAIVFTDGELLTSNCMYMFAGYLAQRSTIKQMTKVLIISFIGNFIGGIAVVLAAFGSGLLRKDPWKTFVISVITQKTVNQKFYENLILAIGCNICVCLAVFLSLKTKDAIAKVFLIWWPIFTFVAIGFEHAPANMIIIPMGLFINGHTNPGWHDFIGNNLLPATIGNVIGGFLVTWYFGYTYYNAYRKSEIDVKLQSFTARSQETKQQDIEMGPANGS